MERDVRGYCFVDRGSVRTLSRAVVREVDRLAIEELGIPGIVLMENAGRHATAALLEHLHRHRGIEPAAVRAAVLCGGGNNGGDGYVIARHLHNLGAEVTLWAFKPVDELTGDAGTNATICQRMRLSIEPAAAAERLNPALEAALGEANVVVDALLGTGFAGVVREPMAGAIEAVNARRDAAADVGAGAGGATVLAVDVPSGLDCDTGTVEHLAVRADVTVTFVAAKRGMLAPASEPWVGELVVADIGAPPELIERAAATVDGR